jgi:Mg/Co/Ni transporter MgtE
MKIEKPQFSFPKKPEIDIRDVVKYATTEQLLMLFNLLKNRSDIAIVGKLYDKSDIQEIIKVDEKTAKEFLDNVDTDTKEINDDCDNAISALFENFQDKKFNK